MEGVVFCIFLKFDFWQTEWEEEKKLREQHENKMKESLELSHQRELTITELTSLLEAAKAESAAKVDELDRELKELIKRKDEDDNIKTDLHSKLEMLESEHKTLHEQLRSLQIERANSQDNLVRSLFLYFSITDYLLILIFVIFDLFFNSQRAFNKKKIRRILRSK